MALSNGVVSLKGTTTLPLVGAATLLGTITDATHYGLAKSLGSYKLGAFTLSNAKVTVNDIGISLEGDDTFLGAVCHLIGTANTNGVFTLTAPLGPVSLINNLVAFSSLNVTMTASSVGVAVSIQGDATIANGIGNVSFQGGFTDQADYTLTGSASINVAGFTISDASLTIGTSTLGVNFTLPVPEVGDVTFGGTYSTSGWSLSATYPGPVVVGPVVLNTLGLKIARDNTTGVDSLTLSAVGTIADLDILVQVPVSATVYSDGRFIMTATPSVLSVGGFSMASGSVTIGNDNTQKQFIITLDADVGIPNFGESEHLHGFYNVTTGAYDFKGNADVSLAGITFADVVAELNNSDGLTFAGNVDRLLVSSTVVGTIDTDGHVRLKGTDSIGAPGGFAPASASVSFDLNPSANNYSIYVVAHFDLLIADSDFSAHSSYSNGDWQPLVLSGGAEIGGALAKVLSGSAQFTFNSNSVSFNGSLAIPNVGGSFDVTGDIHADGSFDLDGITGSAFGIAAADAGRILYAVGANFQDIASTLFNVYSDSPGDIAAVISSEGADLGQIVNALSVVDDNVSQVANAVWNNFVGTTFYLDDLAQALWNHWGGSSYNLTDLSGALSGVVSDLGQVVHALSVVDDNVSQVANAVWNDFVGAAFYLDDLAQALWNHWGGSSYNFGDLAAALSGVIDDLGNVVSALSSVVDDAGQVASAVWNNWAGGSSFSSGDLVGVLEGVFGLDSISAWDIVNGL